MTKIMIPVAMFLALLTMGCGKDDSKSFGRADLNKDGKVIFEEGVIAYPDLTVEEFRLYDKDGGGALSGEEYAVFTAARKSGTPPPAKPQPVAEQAAAPVAPPQPDPAATAQSGSPQVPSAAALAPLPTDAPGAPGALQGQIPANTVTAPSVPDATAANASPPTQSIEVASTAISPEPEKKPAGPSTISYTVQRGDSLNKIARKFKVSVKDIMTKNKIDNPDKVAAGQVLDIPLHEGAAQPGAANGPTPDMTAFVEGFFAKSSAAAPDELLALYADEVDFYKKGVVKKDFVLEDKVRYFERWPARAYTLSGTPKVTPVPGTKRTRIDAPVRYQVKNGDKSASGEALFVFEVVTDGASPRIVFEDSSVTARP
ncbi:LysM peptidoglycan-binding domain-containing protein [Desulfovibrio sulfodismutans]|uniref:LysM peptidoglycan-binding domain-containing protein n=1 Tax=Desulfolutivibrio sulfodismutans TaxID=63561 RepID=A0A7K3NQJ3_9BACT|nr:LysM domain-containing protein [Desulfolutivibrio sulfodismutans]NDY58055.1 LysM peptidoglycan-binding domain-containing protein [Desulfolutivibrio sulfodismutans]QLA13652.1 LysM peptidoglycan-binding domain-containing protein [Desulfolutivibrio sulfodismutans DSM 3696]